MTCYDSFDVCSLELASNLLLFEIFGLDLKMSLGRSLAELRGLAPHARTFGAETAGIQAREIGRYCTACLVLEDHHMTPSNRISYPMCG